MFGICHLSVVPCRAQPSDKSEMVTQLLFGEHFTILSQDEKWAMIKIAADGYECWIDKKQFKPIAEKEFEYLNRHNPCLSAQFISTVKNIATGKQQKITLGSVLPQFNEGKIILSGEGYIFRGKPMLPESQKNAERNGKKLLGSNIIKSAKMYLRAPYLWGGRSPFGIDCSGFVQVVYRLHGIQLPRDAWQQAEKGEALSFIEEAEKGDLAFFDNAEGKIIHAGIITGNNSIIHASGEVRIDTLDHYGIFNKDTGKYSHNLRLIKRVM